MSGVGTWNPDAERTAPTPALLSELGAHAQELDEPSLGLAEHEVARYAGLMRQDADTWRAAAAQLPDALLEDLIRFFTLAEMKLSGWEAGASSPVIPLVAELRARGSYPDELTAWIKAHTDNRFLPYGSLLDRL